MHCADGDVRLMEGDHDWEGRLEMCFNGRWGTIGSSGWTKTNTKIVCDALGYEVSGKRYIIAKNDSLKTLCFLTDNETKLLVRQSFSKPLYRSNVTCSTEALTLIDCGYDKEFKTKDTDVIIRCKKCKLTKNTQSLIS